MNKTKNNNRIFKAITSAILLVVMFAAMFSALYFSRSYKVEGFLTQEQLDALEAELDSQKNDQGQYKITSKDILIKYSQAYYCNADDHENDVLLISLATGTSIPLDGLISIGTEDHPFKGKVIIPKVGVNTFDLYNCAFFDYISTEAEFVDDNGDAAPVKIRRFKPNPDPDQCVQTSGALFANHVVDGSAAAGWKVNLLSDGNASDFDCIIGEIEGGANVTLEFANTSSLNVVSSRESTDAAALKNTGLICGTLGAGAALDVTMTGSGSAISVTSTYGNAGGIVGEMGDNSTLTLHGENYSRVGTVSSDGGHAGGLVGKMGAGSTLVLGAADAQLTSVTTTAANSYAGGIVGYADTVTVNASAVTDYAVSAAVTGVAGAGGLFGYYKNNDTTFDLGKYDITATVYAENCGGVFGVLDNVKGDGSAVALTIKNTGNAGTVNVGSGDASTYATTGYFGGIAGKYSTDDLTNSLILDDIDITVAANASFKSFGGAIGFVEDAAYIKADDLQITATGTALNDSKGYFGGLVGETAANDGVFIDLGSFKTSTEAAGFKGGGIVGSFKKGVLRLSGITDMSSAKSQLGGQLVGENDNVLIYALGNGANGVSATRNGSNEITAAATGWTFKRSNASLVDDIGTWGEVVRIADIEHATNGVLTLNTTAHTVTVKDAVTAMSTQADLVRTALNMQLDSCGCLVMPSTTTALHSTDLSLGASLSFAGTGITGLMRDGGDIADVGCYTGTFSGGGKTVTLAIGEKYGLTSAGAAVSTGEGIGQIYTHSYNGLFAVIGNGTSGTGTVEDLTIDGTVNVRNTVDNMNIGGVAAVSNGNTALDDITASQTVNFGEPSSVTGTEASGKSVGGLIGVVSNSSDNGTIAITGTNTISTTFNISDNFDSWNVVGAFIGKVTSPKFIINIAQGGSDKLTLKHTMVDVGWSSAAVTSAGGLIGYITSNGTYSNRKINIKNLDFNGCTIINQKDTLGGGFLGYAWLDTDTTIDGLTVTDGTITNSAADVGVMCYKATGRWKVDNLTVTKMSLSGGAGTSLGMLVNKAYDGTHGLYLDVLNAGYTLTNKAEGTGITLPNSLGVYDELAAYSAENVINGTNAGVISVNMNKYTDDELGEDTAITDTGTYQNKLTSASSSALGNSKYANSNSRYYYNLDDMDSDDPAENIMLWSVNKYAASNIKGIFDYSADPFKFDSSTDVDLSDYSYYPVYNVPSLTLKNINLTFDYNGIYTLESNGTYNTDGYNRDPSAQNQHYLMQSGLFISNAEGSTLTLNTVKFSGNFLENADYQGVLISGTASGGITLDGLVLDGIVPKYNNGGTISPYKTGYLLVKNVNRADTTKAAIQINLKNISTSDKYTVDGATATVSKSLFGNVYGPAIGIKIESVKLDARTANGSLSALDSAYNTKNSIFTTATFFNSIKTSQAATMIYNYELSADWPTARNVTYGREVSESVEYADKENKYYDSSTYTDPTSGSNTSSEYDFSSWLPYVGTAYTADQTWDAKGCFYREIKVNVPTTDYPAGCGTYNDPYIIVSGAQLTAIAALINTGNISGLRSLQLPKNLYDGIAANATGARWCDGKSDHAVYTYDDEEEDGYKSDDSEAVWTVENVRLYLANAYYKLATSEDNESGNIVLVGGGSGYQGLGGTDSSGKYAFRGVIYGDGITIVNNSANPLVKVSNGCVLKNLSVQLGVNVSLSEQTNSGSSSAYFGYDSYCKYYGGLIGEIMGGDNIIDNSYVKYGDKTITLNGTYGMIVPVGGYVGVIVYGGLIFKNMTATDAVDEDTTVLRVNNSGLTVYYTNNTSNNLVTDNAAIYVNPIVGRVINGYAINESTQFSTSEDGKYHDADSGTARTGAFEHTLKNGKKHYSIADVNKDEANKLNVTTIATSSVDGEIEVPNAQALFILSLITQSCAGTAQTSNGSYSGTYNKNNYNSLSYGSDGSSVYGMSHNADYTNIGKATVMTDSDYSLASGDTAANTAAPYIIRWFTEGYSDFSYQEKYYPKHTTTTDLNGKTFYIVDYYNKNSIENNKYLLAEQAGAADHGNQQGERTSVLKAVDSLESATPILFTKVEGQNYYTLSFTDNGGNTKYLKITESSNTDRSNIEITNSIEAGCYFTVSYSSSKWNFIAKKNNNSNLTKDHYISRASKKSGNTWYYFYNGYVNNNDGNISLIETTPVLGTTSTTHFYGARCVTSTQGYYNITLTGSGTYQLPDSFRGLGCVGMYDSLTGQNNKYSVKLNVFDGNENTIDLDIYLNKFNKDNYFDRLHSNTTQDISSNLTAINGNTNTNNHGIGLFDSVIMKGSTGKFYDFTLTGSVRTAVYNYAYASRGELHDINNDNLFLSVGGVCGWARNNSVNIGFEKIKLGTNLIDLNICGTNHIGGLLGYSGLKSPADANDSNSFRIWIKECSADGISVKATAGTTVGDARQARCGMGAFVGKVQEGAVYIYGTDSGDNNTNLNNYKEVKISGYTLVDGDTENYNMSAGGLVGFAGNGCKIYDMRVSSKSSTITVGDYMVNFAGGMVGGMQSSYSGGKTGVAVFKNCVVTDVNVNGNYAGGIYGGKWDSGWTTYTITMDNCQVIGRSDAQHNTIFGNDSFGDNGDATVNNVAYAGGLIGKLYPYTNEDDEGSVTYNVLIKDCLVKYYDITAADTATSYAGGFIGYASSVNQSVTCYMHDSSVEDCKIGANDTIEDEFDTRNYAGGVVGRIIQKDNNEILGYNIKLDHITSDAGDRMGAWIGYVPSDTNTKKTSIQLTAIAFYNSVFTKNIGNGATLGTASFVFADHDGACEGIPAPTAVSSFNNTNNVNYDAGVDVAKYPYVSTNPQSDMGTGEIITGDGAVLESTSLAGYRGKTAAKTKALKLYTDGNYSTFADTAISGENGILYYMNRTTADEGDRISTWENETGAPLSGVDDFAMIFIANEDPVETTKLIVRYIQLVTNTATDYSIKSDYYNIVPKACVYEGGKFVIKNDVAASISYSPVAASSNALTVVASGADSLSDNKFTLLDVQFVDPFYKDTIAYHLYVPVYVRQVLKYDFEIAVESGTSYIDSDYTSDFGEILIENVGTPVTAYFRYSYKRTEVSWEYAINAGENVNRNYAKYLELELSDDGGAGIVDNFPGDTTVLVLVDPNDGGKAYYSTWSLAFRANDSGDGYILDLSAFKSEMSYNNSTGVYSFTGESFKPNKFQNLMDISVTGSGATGSLVKYAPSDYVIIGDNAYREATDEEIEANEVTFYTIAEGVVGDYVSDTTKYVVDNNGVTVIDGCAYRLATAAEIEAAEVPFYTISGGVVTAYSSGDRYVNCDDEVSLIHNNVAYRLISTEERMRNLDEDTDKHLTTYVAEITKDPDHLKDFYIVEDYYLSIFTESNIVKVTSNGDYVREDDPSKATVFDTAGNGYRPKNDDDLGSTFTVDGLFHYYYLSTPTEFMDGNHISKQSNDADARETVHLVMGKIFEHGDFALSSDSFASGSEPRSKQEGQLQEMNDTYDSLEITMSATIGISDDLDTIKSEIKRLIAQTDVYQSFIVYLTKKEGTDERKIIIGNPTVSGTYSIDHDSTSIVSDASYGDNIRDAQDSDGAFVEVFTSIGSYFETYDSFVVSSVVTMNYSSGAINTQFPGRNKNVLSEADNGVTVSGASNIAFSAAGTTYSKNSVGDDDRGTAGSRIYYSDVRSSVSTLELDPDGDYLGEFTPLGINALNLGSDEHNSSQFDLVAVLNVTEVYESLMAMVEKLYDESDQPTYDAVLTLTLQQKGNDGLYHEDLDLTQYIDNVTLGDGVTLSALDGTADYSYTAFKASAADKTKFSVVIQGSDLTSVDESGAELKLPVLHFTIKTGPAFETAISEGVYRTYGNFRITANVYLRDEDDKVIGFTIVSNFVIYTNAKIRPEYIS